MIASWPLPWRAGRQSGSQPRSIFDADNCCIGSMITPELAQAVCDAMNARGAAEPFAWAYVAHGKMFTASQDERWIRGLTLRQNEIVPLFAAPVDAIAKIERRIAEWRAYPCAAHDMYCAAGADLLKMLREGEP